MGVHGLATLLQNRGLITTTNNSTNNSQDTQSIHETTHQSIICENVPILPPCQPSPDGPNGTNGPSGMNGPNPGNFRQTIPPHSTFAVDGYGLAFHLYHAAYERHYHHVLSSLSASSPPSAVSSESDEAESKLNPNRQHETHETHETRSQRRRRHKSKHHANHANQSNPILHLIPTFLPSNLLQQELRSFLQSLVDHQIHVRIYLDGSTKTSYKSSTDKQRAKQRDGRWKNLEEVCKTGKLEFSRKNYNKYKKGKGHFQHGIPPADFFLQTFPIPTTLFSIFDLEIQLWDRRKVCGVSVVSCPGEADGHVAKASADDDRTYAVGLDTDFLVYGYPDNDVSATSAIRATGAAGAANGRGKVKYIPLTSLSLRRYHNHTLLTGMVITRADVAELLHLPNEEAVIELSILLGNDYTSEFVHPSSRPLHLSQIASAASIASIASTATLDAVTADAPTAGGADGAYGAGVGDVEEEHNAEEYILSTISDNGYEEAVLSFLHDMGEGYEVKIHQNDTTWHREMREIAERANKAMEFTRALFQFRDVSTFLPNELNNAGEEIQSNETLGRGLDLTCTPNLIDLALDHYRSRLHDDGGGDVVVFYERVSPFGRFIFQHEHLLAIEEAIQSGRTLWDGVSRSKPSCLSWECVLAGIAFERRLCSTLKRCLKEFGAVTLGWIANGLPWVDHSKIHEHYLSLATNGDQSAAISTEVEEEIEEVESTDNASDNEEQSEVHRCELPIDEHEQSILDSVRENQITIIHGETGCGKSTRVPLMLFNAPPPPAPGLPNDRPVKMFVSQPRRIAAKSLTDRIRSSEPRFRDVVALRMGHGVREFETCDTRLWFVTTGYLVRLLANKPEEFRDHTHLVIDEIHERSVDTDILCFLARRLLASRPDLRLVLMSATLAATMYQQYFGSPKPPIFVGARRFPINEIYVEDLDKIVHLPPTEAKIAKSLHQQCEKLKCSSNLPSSFKEQQHQLAAHLATSVGGANGSSVLIFVAGMADIISLMERIDKIYVPGAVVDCIPIHSEIELDDQMAVFEKPIPGMLKIIIATNAAESSLTIPDVDHVICLGLCKSIVYDAASHRCMLQACWISKSNAKQRAGRTGRVRAGNVYRLYSRETYESYMAPFEHGEILRMPLDSVILQLCDMLNDNVTNALLECIEPPDVTNIERSFQSLYDAKFIQDPNGQGITSLGSLAVALGIDLSLCSLVGLGIQFGLAAESILLAAVLSFPKSPWMITSPLYHDTDTFNDISLKTYISKAHFDGHLYSDPFSVMNLMWDFVHAKSKHAFCRKYSVSMWRMQQLLSTSKSLVARVAKYMNQSQESLELKLPPLLMQHAKIILLRVLQVWVFSDSIIKLQVKDDIFLQGCGEFRLSVDGKRTAEALSRVLDKERHDFVIHSPTYLEYSGNFEPILEDHSDVETFLPFFEQRFVSFGIESGCEVIWYSRCSGVTAYFDPSFLNKESWVISNDFFGQAKSQTVHFTRVKSANRRGVKGRPCGAWSITSDDNPDISFVKFSLNLDSKTKKWRRFHTLLRKSLLAMDGSAATISCRFEPPSLKKTKNCIQFQLNSSGISSKITQSDACDMFLTPDVLFCVQVMSPSKSQTLIFKPHQGKPMGKSALGSCQDLVNSSWTRPLLHDIPEEVRILSILAAGRRSNFIEFSVVEEDSKESFETHSIELPKKITNFKNRWKHLDSGIREGSVFVNAHSIPASAVPSTESVIYACCATTLRLRNGGIRVEDLTLLPPGTEFLELALLSFGLSDHCYFGKEENGNCDEEESKSESAHNLRMELANDFNETCKDLGEELVCYPDKVFLLCKIFDGVDGHSIVPWEDISYEDHLQKSKSNHNIDKRSCQRRKKKSAKLLSAQTEDMRDITGLVESWVGIN